MSYTQVLNSCWMASCFGEAHRYAAGAMRVRATQERVLLGTIRRNRDCSYGRRHGFQSIRTIDDFRRQVPIVEYDDIRSDVERICVGEQDVLTNEPVLLLEPTSGTSAEEKLIPFTASLQREFQRAVRTWIHDLFRHRPKTRRGRAYWSISPLAHQPRMTPEGIPIGFADDTAYLSQWEQDIVRRTLAVSPEVALIDDVQASRFATLFFLLQAEDLSLVSVWSPTFLIELLRHLRNEWPRLCDSIEQGTIAGAANSGSPFSNRRFTPNHRRAGILRSVFTMKQSEADQVRMIWPRLALVSSWADGASASYAAHLKEMLPNIELQPKGLLATEAFVSLPWTPASAAALAYRSHFFEFVPIGESDATESQTLLADELHDGCQYEVIVTTGGGLYRYRLFDQVEVVGHQDQIPLLRFLGRSNATSDLVGEKLTEAQAVDAIQSGLEELEIRSSYVRLIPVMGPPARYRLSIVAPQLDAHPEDIDKLAGNIDQRLRQHQGYRYARELDQLAMLQVVPLRSTDGQHWNRYESSCLEAGQRLGDIKTRILHAIVAE